MYDSNLYRDLGSVIELLSNSQYHSGFELRRYLQIEIAPAFRYQQVKLFYRDGEPVALVTWARLSSKVLNDLVSSHRSLHDSEWKCGDMAFVNDLVVNGKHLNSIVATIMSSVFWSDSVVYAFRRSSDGSVERLCKFKNAPRGNSN
jgi:hemolysin-activating ACP:hemolysin acyltransferase